jgi:outer membrane receptor protein involved in Fe transport
MCRFYQLSGYTFSLILSTCFLSAPLHAQEANEGVNTVSENTLEEVLVTARRREESLQDVAASIVALGETSLDRLNIKEFSDYVTQVPGISTEFGEGPTGFRGKRTVGIRGVQRLSGLTASTVGFYIDETPVDFPNARIFDMQRIEVLRGPQGTLYGAGSVGGAIRILTNQPDPSGFDATVDATWAGTKGGDDSVYLKSMVNIPLAEDRAALRIVALYEDEGGYIDAMEMTTGFTPALGGTGGIYTGETVARDVNAQKVTGVRAALSWLVTDELTITPSIFYQQHKVESSVDFLEDAGFKDRSKLGLASSASREDFLLASLNFNYQGEKGSIVSSTSWVDIDNDSVEDITDDVAAAFGGIVVFPEMELYASQKQKTITHETRFVSSLPGKVQFTTGIFIELSERPLAQLVDSTEFEALGLPSLALEFAGERDLDQYAVFGEASYFAMDDKLELTLGLRGFRFESKIDDVYGGWIFGGTPATKGSASENGINPKFVASYSLSDDHLIYASVADGFRPGGSNIALPDFCVLPGGIAPPKGYESDTLTSYEAGAKTSWFDNRLNLNVAAYYSDWKDIQVSIPLSGCSVSGVITNSGTAESKGAEVELATRLGDNIDVSFGIAYIDAQLTEDNPLIGASDGDELPNVPEWTYSGSFQYSFSVGKAGHPAYGLFSFNHRSETPLDFSGTLNTDSYAELNLRFGVYFPGDWEVALFGDNLTDTRPMLSLTPNVVLPGVRVISLRPRTFGINLRKRF